MLERTDNELIETFRQMPGRLTGTARHLTDPAGKVLPYLMFGHTIPCSRRVRSENDGVTIHAPGQNSGISGSEFMALLSLLPRV